MPQNLILRWTRAVCFAALLAPSAALADSDGYFCVGPGYLAYQFGMSGPPVAPHRLFVVRLNSDGIASDTMSFELPQFQVHGMLCGATDIRVAAYDAIYTVSLDRSQKPTGFVKVAIPRGQMPIELLRAQRNLGSLGYLFDYKDWGRKVRRSLAQEPSGHEFVLEFVPDPVKPGQCSTEVTTSILEIDANNHVLTARRLFRGLAHRACGE
jgi:hypothetical protein